MTTEKRYLATIARDIKQHWPQPCFSARPYINAMLELGTLHDKYGCEDAHDIVTRFLGNASTWRGDHARRIKAELKEMLAAHKR